jgi:hypothetical protein
MMIGFHMDESFDMKQSGRNLSHDPFCRPDRIRCLFLGARSSDRSDNVSQVGDNPCGGFPALSATEVTLGCGAGHKEPCCKIRACLAILVTNDPKLCRHWCR